MRADGRLASGLLITAAAALGWAAAPAAAATVLGSDLTAPADGGQIMLAPSTFFTMANATVPASPAADATIVSIRLKHAANATAAQLGWRLVTRAERAIDTNLPAATETFVSLRKHERLPDFTLPVGPAGIVTVIPKDLDGAAHGVPIAGPATLPNGSAPSFVATEHLGLSNFTKPVGSVFHGNGAVAGAQYGYVGAGAPGGYTSQGISGHNVVGDDTQTELLLQYTVEPDADKDGYGDESQDPCPSTPGNCAPPETVTVTTEVPGPTTTVTTTSEGAGPTTTLPGAEARPAPAYGKAAITGGTLKANKGIVKLHVSCPATAAAGCKGTIWLLTAKPLRLGPVKVVIHLGTKAYELGAGKSTTLPIKLVKGHQLLAPRKAKSLAVTALGRNLGVTDSSARLSVTLR